jgi:outer membrane lipoprotein carrier protein
VPDQLKRPASSSARPAQNTIRFLKMFHLKQRMPLGRKTIVSLVLAFVATSFVTSFVTRPFIFANDPTDEEILQGISNRYQGLLTFKANYSRVTLTPTMDTVFKNQASQKASGIIFWGKPYQLKLEQNLPEPEIMVTDGKQAWWYIPREKTAHYYNSVDLAGEFQPLTAFFNGLEELRKKYEIQRVPDPPSGLYGFVLKPRVKDYSSGTLTIYCDKNSNLKGFRIQSATGEETNFELQDLQLNPKLQSSFFNFRPPKGTQVVTEDFEGGV